MSPSRYLVASPHSSATRYASGRSVLAAVAKRLQNSSDFHLVTSDRHPAVPSRSQCRTTPSVPKKKCSTSGDSVSSGMDATSSHARYVFGHSPKSNQRYVGAVRSDWASRRYRLSLEQWLKTPSSTTRIPRKPV